MVECCETQGVHAGRNKPCVGQSSKCGGEERHPGPLQGPIYADAVEDGVGGEAGQSAADMRQVMMMSWSP